MSLSFKVLIISLNPLGSTTSINLLGYVDTPLKDNTVCLPSTVRDHRLVLLVQHSSNPDTLQTRLTSYPRTTGVTVFHETLIKYFKKSIYTQNI